MVLSDLKDLLFQISENKIIYQYSNSTLDDTSTHWLKISTKQQNNLKRNTRVVYDKKPQKKPLQNSEFWSYSYPDARTSTTGFQLQVHTWKQCNI